MKVEMICTGEEVLLGQIIDTNAAWVAAKLMDVGVELSRRVTVGDRMEDLISVFRERSQFADVIIVNGGLGPTTDDMSALAMAKAKQESLVESSLWRERLESWYADNNRIMPQSNLKQAMLPESAILVDNPVGTACGFRVKFNRAWLFFTPGVPFEMKQMINEQFIPFIQDELGAKSATSINKLLTIGQGESSLQDQLSSLVLPEGIELGYRSSMPYIDVKIFARGQAAINCIDAVTDDVKKNLGNVVVSDTHASLAEEIHHCLSHSGLSLSVAESCTGGMIASQLIDFPGSSGYLQHGLVTYSNESKVKLLGVKPQTLDDHGAVSIKTVEEMAEGVRTLLDSDYAIATSGIAGPDGGTETKPVGTVAIALAVKNGGIHSQMLTFPVKKRQMIRAASTAIAFDMLRRALLDSAVIVDYPFFSRNPK
ncbi:CinA family nicotinamide mononucleotide deamidase-related protein [Shewanella intestini]|uniref:CinA-like protein n=1 Tax=Shewanella intestini TaxID=2017544 RepID=A0ABS5I3U5_9GAMM|nr:MULTISPECIES: CinA family nicotinamide mononucleotide deamidase-related protein [Shewanella]MBR9728694.1 CinA family nicotinamide mononucleotide deamidase-related protein [Shewanella intestini]MRG37617.1 CinA family nicotinamide mononucleotide deamidase-related protein [Shewanella sp. XMDDZSB0408]